MDTLTVDQNTLERWVTPHQTPTLPRPKTLVVGVGGTGVLIATYIAAAAQRDPAVACIGIDVMADPPVVVIRDDAGATGHMLEMKREFAPIGRDLDPPHLSSVLRERPGRDVLRWLLEKQPGGRFIKSVEIGTANNTFRALGTVNENGEPNILGSPGLLRAVFDGPRVGEGGPIAAVGDD